MPERFHHPQVDRLREAMIRNPGSAARGLGRTMQRRLHRQVMAAEREARLEQTERRWGPGANPDIDRLVAEFPELADLDTEEQILERYDQLTADT